MITFMNLALLTVSTPRCFDNDDVDDDDDCGGGG